MTQSLLTPTVIAKEALMQLENNMVMAALVHRDYKKEFVKIGDSVTIRKPVKFSVTDGATRTNQDVEEGSTSITINQRKHVSWGFSTNDLTLSIQEYSERYITPAMISLANNVDAALCGLYSSVPTWVGTPGQTINSFADFSVGAQRLDEMAVPKSGRNAVLSPADYWGMVGNLTGLAIDANSTSDKALKQGLITHNIAGINMAMDQNVKRHTVGVGTGTPLTDGGSQEVTYNASLTSFQQTLVTDGWTTAVTLAAGDVITIDTVFAVNPVSKETLDFLQPFTLVSAVTANATTTADTTLTITPPIIVAGPYQTVSTSPADGATINYIGTASTAYPQNLVFHKNAFALVTVPLEMPDSAGWKARESRNGLSVRLVKFYDGDNDVEYIRADILYGVQTIYPELAARISGSA